MLVPCPMCGESISPNAATCVYCAEPLRGGIGGGDYGGLWQDGKSLVMEKGTELPDRCVKSNQPTDRRLKRSLSWHPPALIVLFLFTGPLIYIIVALCVRKTARVQIGLSDEWFEKRTRATILGWGSFLLGVLLVVLGIAFLDKNDGTGGLMILAGILIGLFGSVIGLMNSRMVFPKKITKTHVWLNGVSPEYLTALPEWEGGR